MEETRNRMIGSLDVEVSTRLLSCTPPNVTSGNDTGVPTRPVCVIPFSHKVFACPSPGSLKTWLSVHQSTSPYPLPRHTWVVTEASRFCVQNVGEYWPTQLVVEEQYWSTGTSGQFDAFAVV